MGWGDIFDDEAAPDSSSPAKPTGARVGRHISDAGFRTLWGSVRSGIVLWAILLSTIGGFSFVATWSDMETPAASVVIASVNAVIIAAFVASDRVAIGPLLRTSGITLKNLYFPSVAFLGIMVFMTTYVRVLGLLGAKVAAASRLFLDHDWPIWSIFLLTSIVPAVTEEAAFRGFIYGRLAGVMRPSDACLVQAMMFSVLHFSPIIFVSHFVMGWVFGRLRMMTQSLWPGIAVHALWNAWVVWTEIR